MNWEKCRRCGSNRVIKQYSDGGAKFFLALGFIMSFVMSGVMRGTPPLNLFLYGGFASMAFGMYLSSGSGHLFCKDCEVKWRPAKVE